jgi:hypothetical protein
MHGDHRPTRHQRVSRRTMCGIQCPRSQTELDGKYHPERNLQRLPGDCFDRPVHHTAEFIADYGDNVYGHHGYGWPNVLLRGDGGGFGRHTERRFEHGTGDDTFAVSCRAQFAILCLRWTKSEFAGPTIAAPCAAGVRYLAHSITRAQMRGNRTSDLSNRKESMVLATSDLY